MNKLSSIVPSMDVRFSDVTDDDTFSDEQPGRHISNNEKLVRSLLNSTAGIPVRKVTDILEGTKGHGMGFLRVADAIQVLKMVFQDIGVDAVSEYVVFDLLCPGKAPFKPVGSKEMRDFINQTGVYSMPEGVAFGPKSKGSAQNKIELLINTRLFQIIVGLVEGGVSINHTTVYEAIQTSGLMGKIEGLVVDRINASDEKGRYFANGKYLLLLDPATRASTLVQSLTANATLLSQIPQNVREVITKSGPAEAKRAAALSCPEKVRNMVYNGHKNSPLFNPLKVIKQFDFGSTKFRMTVDQISEVRAATINFLKAAKWAGTVLDEQEAKAVFGSINTGLGQFYPKSTGRVGGVRTELSWTITE